MKFSDDALLQAAATIVAGQISAKVFPVEMTAEDEVSSAMESALAAVMAAAAKATAKPARREARKAATGKFAPLKAPRTK